MNLPRLFINLTVRILPSHRKTWGEAMQAEFAAIPNRSDALDFALGCLWAALTERITVMKLITATGRLGVGLVTLLTGAWFLHGVPQAILIFTGQSPDPFYQMLIRHHHIQAAADHVHAYPYIFLFALLMGISYTGAGFFLIRWRLKPFAVFCALAVLPAVGLLLVGILHDATARPLSYAWPFLPLTLLVAAAVFLDWLGREPGRPLAA